MKALNPFQKRSNRRMTLFFLGVTCLLILTGCSSYQYVYIDSHLKKTETKEFIHETDSFTIKYAFSGENFGVDITVFNKLDRPIYIDWNRSTLIINGIQEDGSFYNDNQIDSIPPNSYAAVTSNILIDQFIDTTPLDSLGNKEVSNSRKAKSKIHLYDENNTPIFFRNILALTTHENSSAPIYFDDSFWISEIFQTMNCPSSGTEVLSNQFYIRKPTVFGHLMRWTAGISAILVLGRFE
jgi:hypothetical protein